LRRFSFNLFFTHPLLPLLLLSSPAGDDDPLYQRTRHDASLPTSLCECNGWKIPKPRGADSIETENADVAVTVDVVAENAAGETSPAATLSFTRPASTLSAALRGEDGEDGEDAAACPPIVNAPRSPPRRVTARRVRESDGGGVLVAWSRPGPREGSNDGRRRRRGLLRDDDEEDPDADVDDEDLGYQVTWIAWRDDGNAPVKAVIPPASVVLSDDDAVARNARAPCGAGGESGGESERDDDACFFTSAARSLRLEARSISHWSPYDRVGVVNAVS
jgi:hypothetical protein